MHRPLRALAVLAAAGFSLTLALPAAAQQLTVSAAASLTEAMREIGRRFEASRPGVSLRFNFAASGALVQQIIQGAPVDVFASADQETMARGVAQKVIDVGTRRDFASNSLVMITPLQGAPALARLTDLTQPAVKRIAVGKPATVPVGRYTQQALTAAQIWAPLEPKLVFADNVRQVLDYVARGEVEAGFVYRTDAELMKDRVRVALTATGHAPITYPVAVVTDSRQPQLARDFAAWLQGSEAQSVLARYGFGTP
ncbi:MAG TPA: molybdate ABC transporter substrate-binding protein [Burkholderiaceae bacterium]|nr:molybdate ABC transporter substrate-binding protein [Burkholderiaceae bacterium]